MGFRIDPVLDCETPACGHDDRLEPMEHVSHEGGGHEVALGVSDVDIGLGTRGLEFVSNITQTARIRVTATVAVAYPGFGFFFKLAFHVVKEWE